MNMSTRKAILAIMLFLVALPAAALASGRPSNPGAPDNQSTQTAASHKPSASGQPGPTATLPAKAKAYGYYCQSESKTHAAGQQGTPFSQCVTAMAKLASGSTASPKKACAALSKQHVTGQKGTPFSKCVVAGARLLKDKHSS
jgi:hypothetical protein